MYKKCLVCGSAPENTVLNSIEMYKCTDCGLVWKRSMDVPTRHYEEKDIDLGIERLRTRVDNCKARVKTFKKHANLNNLCDIGCGEGIFLKMLKDMGYTNAIGIEPSNRISDFAEVNDLEIIKGSVDDIDKIIKGRNIDIISLLHVIEHLTNPEAILKKISDLLPENGTLIIETPDIESYSMRKTEYHHQLVYPEHLFYFSQQALRRLLRKAGFTIVASGNRDFDPYNMNIKESLFRLGLVKRNEFKESNTIFKVSDTPDATFNSQGNKKVHIFEYLKKPLRRILIYLVILSGRQDFLWVIARKNV